MNSKQPDQSEPSRPQGLSDAMSKLFARPYFSICWIVFLGFMVRFVAWPLRDAALVFWVYGCNAYFKNGIRVLPGKPVRFSNGDLAPELPDFVTGFGAFWITVGGLTVLLAIVVQMFRRKSSH